MQGNRGRYHSHSSLTLQEDLLIVVSDTIGQHAIQVSLNTKFVGNLIT